MGNGKPNNLATIKMLEEAKKHDKELIEKCLNNGGIYDTNISNGNSTATVIRETGYSKYIGVIYNSTTFTYGVRLICQDIPDAEYKSATSLETYGQSNWTYSFACVATPYSDIPNSVCIYNKRLYIFVNGATSREEAIEFVLKNPPYVQYKRSIEYQFTEKVIENQPIHIANQEECLYWNEEWRKGLNLWKPEWTPYTEFNATGNTAHSLTWEISLNPDGYTEPIIYFLPATGTGRYFGSILAPTSGTYYSRMGYNGNVLDDKHVRPIYLEAGAYSVSVNVLVNEANRIVIDKTIMLNKGTVPYPYEPYNGKILREKDLSGIQLFPENVNPAQTLGGTWEKIGEFTVGSTTVHAWKRL